MPKRIPLHTIILHRDGKRVVPEVGKPFEFTSEELKSIKEASPSAVREPINESTGESATEKTEGKPQGGKAGGAKGNQGADKGGEGSKADSETL